MIKFFRHIRQNLIMENPPKENSRAGKTGKYLKYAIGEIVLVVIGILIALQINNWNQNRINKIEEQDYYCKFLDDVRQDYDMLIIEMEKAKERLHHSNKLLQNLQKEHTDLAELSNEMKLAVSRINANLQPTKTAFEDLKSSGSLKIIRDDNLKKKVSKLLCECTRYNECH